MKALLIAIASVAATAQPAVPIQAEWQTEQSIAITIQPVSKPMSISDDANIEVALTSPDGAIVSPFAQFSRGITFDVRDERGEKVKPSYRLATSPPAPPVPAEKMKRLTSSPHLVHISEKASGLFPKAGVFQIRALLHVIDFEKKPVRYHTFSSAPVRVEVR